jgi:hypothetical protein
MSATRSSSRSANPNAAVRDRAANASAAAHAAIANSGRVRAASNSPLQDRVNRTSSRRATSLGPTAGRQSSVDDSQEDEEDSSAGDGAGSSSAGVGAGISSADDGAGRSRPATAISGTSPPNPTTPYPNLNSHVPSALTKVGRVDQVNDILNYYVSRFKLIEASDIAALELSKYDLLIALAEMLGTSNETVVTNSHTSSVNVVSVAYSYLLVF